MLNSCMFIVGLLSLFGEVKCMMDPIQFHPSLEKSCSVSSKLTLSEVNNEIGEHTHFRTSNVVNC